MNTYVSSVAPKSIWILKDPIKSKSFVTLNMSIRLCLNLFTWLFFTHVTQIGYCCTHVNTKIYFLCIHFETLPNVVLKQIRTDTAATSKHINHILIGIPSHQDVGKITHKNYINFTSSVKFHTANIGFRFKLCLKCNVNRWYKNFYMAKRSGLCIKSCSVNERSFRFENM